MVADELAKLGIRVSGKHGEHRTTCPNCSNLRRKKRDRCLAVRIDADGARFNCWHCGHKGGITSDFRSGARLRGGSEDQRGDFGLSERRLRYGVGA